MSRRTRKPRRLLCTVVALMCLAVVTESVSAATRTLAPTRVKRGTAEFKLTKISAADIKRAYLQVGKTERKLKLSIVRKAAERGVLKVKLPRTGKKSSGKKKRPRVRLRLVLSKPVVKPPAGGTGGGGSTAGGGGGGGGPVDPFPGNGSLVVSAAGDIACDPASWNLDYNNGNGTATDCRHKYTAPLLAGSDAVLALGDESYGYANAFETSYGPTWGAFKSITHPIAGDHEYDSDAPNSDNITRYFNYFGVAAGDPAKGYYSFEVGSWHVVALNSNCTHVACDAASPQVAWLQSDLLAHNTAQCTLVYWHHPHFTDGPHVPDEEGSTQPFWDAAIAANADVILHGNDHNYQRWSKMNALGASAANGIRQFVVGTGGKSHTTPTGTAATIRNGDTFGVLKLRLKSAGYDWRFIPESGKTFTDQGTDTCS